MSNPTKDETAPDAEASADACSESSAVEVTQAAGAAAAALVAGPETTSGLDASAEPAPAPPSPDGATVDGSAQAASSVGKRVLAVVGEAAGWVGWGVARGTVWTAQRVAEGYRAIDPDLRRHVAHAPIVGLTHIAPARTDIRALPDDGFRPVLFVHGLAGHPGNFAPMRGYFRFMGRTRTYAIAFRASDRIPDMARDLIVAIEQIVATNDLGPGARIDVVAHSMGGLVTRYALETSDIARHIDTLLTLGTPHHGTYAARYAATAQTIDLRPNSEVLQTLGTQVPWPPRAGLPHLIALWSEADMLLLPPESAQMPGAQNVELRGSTHLSYLIEPRAWQTVWDSLERPARP